MTTYNWTTGPVHSSEGLDNVRVTVLNNTSYTREATIRIYDLSKTPKKKVLDKTITLNPWQTKHRQIDSALNMWEAQVTAYSKSVRPYVSGRKGSKNLNGNSVLNAEFKSF